MSQLALDLHYHPDYRRKYLSIGPHNETAVGWIDRWPDWPDRRLALYGGAGCGKTHLAHIWVEKAEAIWLTEPLPPPDYPGEAFVLDLPTYDETWLFHFYNLCQERGAYWLLCHRQPPSQWPVNLPDLRSRLTTIPTVAIEQPDEEVLHQLLEKLFRERGVIITKTIATYLLNRTERSFQALNKIVADIDAMALAQKRPINLALIRTFLNL